MVVELIDFGHGFSAYTCAKLEARFIYNEIFNDHCYDISKLPADPFLIDAGANIGMFFMYMKRKHPSARILAFEPAPATFDILRRNMELHHIVDVETHRCALGAEDTTDTLTFYPMVPGNSTFVPEEKEISRALIEEEHPKELVDKMFNTFDNIDVPVRRLSEFLQAEEYKTRDIDLLKIDVEARELDVCRGLDDADWARVRNVTIEVLDVQGALAATEGYVKAKGFALETRLSISSKDDAKKPKVYMVIGRRREENDGCGA